MLQNHGKGGEGIVARGGGTWRFRQEHHSNANKSIIQTKTIGAVRILTNLTKKNIQLTFCGVAHFQDTILNVPSFLRE